MRHSICRTVYGVKYFQIRAELGSPLGGDSFFDMYPKTKRLSDGVVCNKVVLSSHAYKQIIDSIAMVDGGPI